MNVIQTNNLSKAYGERRGIHAVSFALGRGEILGFLGPNGAGKSTTIRLLLGFLRATGGEATILGKDCWTQSREIKRSLGYIAGDVRLYPWLTVENALAISSDVHGRDLRKPGCEFAERFALERDLPVRKMSRGNRQKVALVLALAHEPQLLILDEPTSGLDPLMQETLADCLRETATDGRSVFFSSHTLGEVESLCDRVAIVRAGRIVVDEHLHSLKERSPRTAVLRFATAENAKHADWPPFVHLKRRYKTECELQLDGAAAPLLGWAATRDDLADISISPPSLDALFRSYYEE